VSDGVIVPTGVPATTILTQRLMPQGRCQTIAGFIAAVSNRIGIFGWMGQQVSGNINALAGGYLLG
jgi:hypothetical protein